MNDSLKQHARARATSATHENIVRSFQRAGHGGDLLLDLCMMALCVYREARGDPPHGKLAVAWVVKNRALTGHRGKHTYRDVVLDPKQFSAFNPGDPNAVIFPDHDAIWITCLAAAVECHLGTVDPTAGALYYHAQSITPSWDMDKLRETGRAGNHIFYTEA